MPSGAAFLPTYLQKRNDHTDLLCVTETEYNVHPTVRQTKV